MMAQSPPQAGAGVRGWHVAAGVCAFFAAVIAVDATFAILAVRTHPGEVSVTPYEDGLVYNRHIAQLEAQDRLGWRAFASMQGGQVLLRFEDRDAKPVRGLAITGELRRPATETGQVPLVFAETTPGAYAASSTPVAGVWDLTAEARGPGGEVFIATRRLAP